MNLLPLQKLGLVLGILAENTENTSVNHIALKAKGKISISDTGFVLKKLVNDKYVTYLGDYLGLIAPNNQNSYSITFNGLVFNQQGGYAAENEEKRKKDRKDNIYAFAITTGTVLAGVYALFEITQWTFHHFHWHLPI